MNVVSQLQMFEPEGAKLADLVRVYDSVLKAEQSRAFNLGLSGFVAAAQSRLVMAFNAESALFQCEMALQFEQLAGLS